MMKQFTHLLLMLFFVMAFLISQAQDIEYNGATYTVQSDTAVFLTNGKQVSGNFEVPLTVQTYTVTGIGKNAFAGNKSLTGITFPATVKFIGKEAFLNCSSLTGQVALNKGITVQDDAFAGCCKVRYLLIKGEPAYIANGSLNFTGLFDMYVNMKKPPHFDPTKAMVVDLEPELDWCMLYVPIGYVEPFLENDKWNVFGSIEETEFDEPADEGSDEPYVPDDPVIVPDSVPGTVFVGTAGTLKDHFTDEEKYSTANLALSGVLNGDDILYLREMCGTSLDGTMTDLGNLRDLDLTHARIVKGGGPYYSRIETFYTENDVVGNSMFSNCATLQRITLPSEALAIGNDAFGGAVGLTQVNMGDRIKSIGATSFYNTSIEELFIPDSCTSIGTQAFWSVETLRKIHLPASLKSLKMGVFYFCVNLNDVVIPEGVTKIEDLAFFNCQNLSSINIPKTVTEINTHAFNRCYSLTDFDVDEDNSAYCDLDGVLFDKDMTILQLYPVAKPAEEYIIPDNVRGLQNDAFWEADNLKRIVMDRELEVIGNGTFSDCDQLEEIVFSGKETSIGQEAFAWCHSLKQVNLPASVQTLGHTMFMDAGLTSFSLPEGQSNMPYNMLYSCHNLTEATLPSTCTYVEDGAFYGCDAMTKLTINALTPPEVYYDDDEELFEEGDYFCGALEGVNCENCVLVVPAGSKQAYADHFIWKRFGTIVEKKSGDVNGDDEININDVVDLIDYLFSKDALIINLVNADVDADGQISISDVTNLIDLILSQK